MTYQADDERRRSGYHSRQIGSLEHFLDAFAASPGRPKIARFRCNYMCAHTAITIHWPRQTILSMSIGLIERLGFKSLQQRGWRAELVRPFPWWICSSAERNNLVFGRYPDKLRCCLQTSVQVHETHKITEAGCDILAHSVNVITCADCHWIKNEHLYTHQPLYQAPVTRK